MAIGVIGGAGFIGSHLVDELLVQGFSVDVIDNLSTGKIENLYRWKGHPKLEFARVDGNDLEVIKRFMDHKDWVFNFAPIRTAEVVDAAMLAGAKRFINNSGDHSASGMWEQELPVVSLEFSDVYGPRGPKTGKLFVSDVVRANMKMAMNREIIGHVKLEPMNFDGFEWKPLVDEKLGTQIMEQYEKANSIIISG